MKRLIKVVWIAGVVGSATGCTWVFSTPSGIREMGKAANGMVVTGKASPDVEDAYHKNERIRISLGGQDDRAQ